MFIWLGIDFKISSMSKPCYLLAYSYNIEVPLTITVLPLHPERELMNVPVSPQQFSCNWPPDNLLFSSVSLVWPLAQPLLQLSTKTQDLLPLFQCGSCKVKKEKKKKSQLDICGFTRILNLFEVFHCFINVTQHSCAFWLSWKTTLLTAVVCLILWGHQFISADVSLFERWGGVVFRPPFFMYR